MNGFRPVEYYDEVNDAENNDDPNIQNFASFDKYDNDCKSWIPMVS
jgi:hypothetical protein